MSAKPASAHDALAVAKAWVDAANAKDLEAAGRIVAPDFNFSMLPASLNGPTNVVGRDNFTKGFGAVLGLLVNPKVSAMLHNTFNTAQNLPVARQWTIVNSNASEGKAWLSVSAHNFCVCCARAHAS